MRNRSYAIGALVDLPAPGCRGCALRPGLALRRPRALRQGQPTALHLQLRRQPDQTIVADRELPTGEDLILSAAFEKDGEDPPGTATGILSIYHGDEKVGEERINTQPGAYGLTGTGLTVGRSERAITDDLPGVRPWHFTGGTLKFVAVDVSGDPYVDLEREAEAMLMRE